MLLRYTGNMTHHDPCNCGKSLANSMQGGCTLLLQGSGKLYAVHCVALLANAKQPICASSPQLW